MLVLLLMLFGVSVSFISCTETTSETQGTAVEELEARYQALLDQPAEGKQMDEVWATMKDLASAYYQRGKENGGADGPEDMYRAADLYSASFEYNEAIKICVLTNDLIVDLNRLII
ncbi:MAG: hypothetical protein AAFQ87_28260, partial [Bacteroidota bacterium]